MAFQISSPAFGNNSPIPKRHTCDGENRSPGLAWTGAPAETKSFALICDDPDAPRPKKPGPTPWVHWVMYNIAGSVTQLPEGIPRVAEPPQVAGAKQGKNSWDSDNTGYRGPMPPPGSGAHRYFFKLYALDTVVDLDPSKASKDALLRAIKGHVLAEGQVMCKYER